MQAGIVAGIETGLADNRLRLRLASIVDEYAGANRAAVRFHAFQLYFEPVVFSAYVVSKKRRRFIQVDHENVDVSVVVEISNGAAPATVCGSDTGAGGIRQLLELAFAEIPKHTA